MKNFTINRPIVFSPVKTDPYSAVAKASANELVGTAFASRYRLQRRVGFKKPNV